jgi:hypothetical protein
MFSCLNGDVIMKWSLCTCYKEPVEVTCRSVATFNNLVSSLLSCNDATLQRLAFMLTAAI